MNTKSIRGTPTKTITTDFVDLDERATKSFSLPGISVARYPTSVSLTQLKRSLGGN